MRRHLRDARGMTMVEMLVAGAIFAIVALAAGTMYVSSQQSFATASAETFLQRQGTLIQEELERHVLRASGIQIQTTATKLCGRSGFTPAVNQSMLYQRFVDSGSGLVSQFWCLFKEPAAQSIGSLFRCRVPSNALGASCDLTLGPIENLLTGTLMPRNQVVNVMDAAFAFFVPGGGVTPVATTVDLRFDLDLRNVTPSQSLLYGPRRFQFNLTTRN
jgi:prepilin-type N-terminal cleavage/methylation domain-containing protein